MKGYRVGVPKKKKYTLLFNEDGLLPKNKQQVIMAEKQSCDDRKYSFAYPLPAYGVAIFKY